jgi:hypothetical protein
MDADYSIELGPTAPALELPWHDPSGRCVYVNLRRQPERITELDDVQSFPVLGELLRLLNAPGSPWETAKCDVWSEEEDSAENETPAAAFSQHCYVDLVLSAEHQALRNKLALHETLASQIAHLLEENGEELDATAAEVVIRRCYYHPDGAVDSPSEDGYCLTLYLSGYGVTRLKAEEQWRRALQLAGCCLPGLTPLDSEAPNGEVG